MEKKNTLLLTVIAVATLLVAVVGATFAYFASTVDIANGANVTAEVANSTSSFTATGAAMAVSIDASNMIQAKAGTWSIADNGNLVVKYTASNMTCNYDIVYTWDTNKAYDPTTTATRGDNLEFTYAITNAKTVTETNFTKAGGTVTSDSITSNGTEVTKTYDIMVKFYNIDADQSLHGGKTYSGSFKVANVVCQ